MALTFASCEKPPADASAPHDAPVASETMHRFAAQLYVGDATLPFAIGELESPSALTGSTSPVSGKWVMKSESGDLPTPRVPMERNGQFQATNGDGHLVIDFHPGTVDHNIFLIFDVGEAPIAVGSWGRWEYVSDAGVEAQGRAWLEPISTTHEGK